MKISVIIPSYQPGEYLYECLDSLRNQTLMREDFEVILVLNGPNDPYEIEIQEYITKHKDFNNLKLVYTSQAGVSNARNMALDMAKGDYIAFVDDDDYVSETYLKDMLAIADKSTVVLSNTSAFNDGAPETMIPYHVAEVYAEMHDNLNIPIYSRVRTYFSGPCMKLIPMSIIGDRRFDVRFKNGEDSLFMFLISDRIKNIRFTSSSAIYYRRFRHNSALMKKRTAKERILNVFKSLKEYVSIYKARRYNFLFFISRILAEFRSLFRLLISR